MKYVKGCEMSFEEWLETYADSYVLSLPEHYQYDMFLDFIMGGLKC